MGPSPMQHRFTLACVFLVSQAWACSGDLGGGTGGGGGAAGLVGTGAVGQGGGADASSTSATKASVGEGGTGGVPTPCDVDGVSGTCLDVADCQGDFVPVTNHCAGPANIQCCVPAGSTACDPDATPLPNEGLVEAPGVGGCPSGMIPIDDFCIDRFEASLVYADDGGSFSPFHNPDMLGVRAVSIEGAVPQAYIDGDQAADACAAAGKRLCGDDEWLRACRGPDDFVYPYGDTLELGVCNDHRAEHPAIEYFGTDADWIWSELGNACIDQLPASLDTTGANPGCVTAEGAFDMMGNLHEWTADPAGTFRGGYYVDTVINGPGCLYATTAHNTEHWDYSTGFRCCADP